MLDVLFVNHSEIDELTVQAIPSFDFHDGNVGPRDVVYSHVKEIT